MPKPSQPVRPVAMKLTIEDLLANPARSREILDQQVPEIISEIAARSSALKSLEAAILSRLLAARVSSADGQTLSKLLNAGALAEILSVPESWVREQARLGNLPCKKLGHYVRFDVKQVERFLAEKDSDDSSGAKFAAPPTKQVSVDEFLSATQNSGKVTLEEMLEDSSRIKAIALKRVREVVKKTHERRVALQAIEAAVLLKVLSQRRASARLDGGARKRVTAAVLAEILGVPEAWVREEARLGDLPSIKFWRYLRFPLDRVERVLAERAQRS
ncbi:MAG: helix-turn-helix domain-containing protein [Terriglobia bacterium]